jgi:hypothetical protein
MDEDRLIKLQSFCLLYKNLQKDIEKQEEYLKSLNKEFEKVSRELIPGLLEEVGLSEIKLSTGEKVEVKNKLKASIADKNYLAAYRNMIILEGGDESAKEKVESLFKSGILIEGEVEDSLLEFLIEKGIPYELKKSIHPQTLKAYCEERRSKGFPIPEGISIYEYQETKIK